MGDSLKPLFKWSGGKRREIEVFEKYYPDEFKVFVEPFVGAGAVFFDLNFEGQNFIADTNQEVVCLFNQCKKKENMLKIAKLMENPWRILIKSPPLSAKIEFKESEAPYKAIKNVFASAAKMAVDELYSLHTRSGNPQTGEHTKAVLYKDIMKPFNKEYNRVMAPHKRALKEKTELHHKNAFPDDYEPMSRTGEQTYYFVRDCFPLDSEINKAFRFYYLRKTAFRGMIRYGSESWHGCGNKFNIPWGRYDTVTWNDLYNEEYCKLLSRTQVKDWSFERTMDKFKNNKDAFIFLDPPYDSEFSDYGTAFGAAEHRLLAECFKESKAKCLMVIGETELTRELYKDYIVGSYNKKYEFRIYDKRIKSEDIDNDHLIVMNYEKSP